MAATILSLTEYKPNVPNSNFTVFNGSRTKESTKLSHLTSYIWLTEQKTEPETPALTGNWLIGISSNDPQTFWRITEEERSWLLQFWPHGNTYPVPKSGNLHDPSPWTRNAGQHSGKDDCTCHLGTLHCPIWGSLYICGVYSLHSTRVYVGGFCVCA